MYANVINAIIWLVGLGVIWYLVSFIPIPHPFSIIVTVLFVVLAIIVLVSIFGLYPFGVPRPYKG